MFFWEVITIWSEAFSKSRRCALKPLQSLKSRDSQLRQEGAIRVLEIGAGLGGNFEHITRAIKYTNVDPNVEFGSAFLRQLRRNPKVELEQWIQGYGEDMSQLASSHFDVVMFTYLLCSVKNARKVLEEAKRVMVKGGTLIFLEHVAFPEGTWQRLLQNAVTPLWKVTCCNCHLNRDSVKQIEDAGFSYVTAKYIDADTNVLLSRHAYGIAIS
ncbi:thiol S-methyltransferase TMT1B-like [Dermacentor variabilis]|uniref:thiol S-methyltransferase TMT1B-like n=1 Tax=Dermacentor variabilis TaxID=34621 RepID=UPI003F5B574B